MRLRKFLPSLMIAALLAAPAALRADADQVRVFIPADARLAVILPSVQQLGGGLARLGEQTGMAARLPLLGGDLPGELAKVFALKLDQLDPAGALAVVVTSLPADGAGEAGLAVLLPVKDFAAFAAANEAVAGDGGVYALTNARGRKMLLRQVGSMAVLARDAASLAAVVKPAVPLALGEHAARLLAEADVFVHVNVSAVGPAAWARGRPALAKLLKQPADGLAAFNDVVQSLSAQCESLDLGLTLAADGVKLRLLATAKEGSAMAAAFAAAPGVGANDKPLIRGVPLTGYLLAAGRLAAPANEFSGQLTDQFAKALSGAGADPGQTQAARDLEALTRRMAVSVVPAKPGERASLPVVATVVREVSDPAKARPLLRQVLKEQGEKLAAKVPAPPAPPAGEGQPAPERPKPFTFAENAETIGGAEVDLWILDAKALGKNKDFAQFAFGGPKLVMRIGFKGNLAIATLGGNAAAFQAALDAAAKDESLADDPGFKKVQGRLVEPRTGVALVSLDRVADAAIGLLSLMVGGEVPAFPKADSPVAVSAGFAGRTADVRLFLPASLLTAGRDWLADFQRRQRERAEQDSGGGAAPGEDF